MNGLSVIRILKSMLKSILVSSIVGIFVGIVNAAFLKSLEFVTSSRMSHSWLIFLLPLSGAIVSFLYMKIGRNSIKGNNLIIDGINEGDEKIPLRMTPMIFTGTVLTHLFGGSAGREGTGVQIGGSIADWICRKLKLNKQDRRIILMSGVSSGFSAVFGTPLAGMVFGLEIAVIGFISYEAIIPCMASAFISNGVTGLLGIKHTHYIVQNYISSTPINFFKIIIAAIFFGLASRLFSELTHRLKLFFSSKLKNAMLRSFIGGAIIILLTYIVGTRDYLGLSLPLIKQSLNGHVSPFAFLWKILFTSITLGTGFQGGEVTPLFVIGSALGNFLGNVLQVSPSHIAALGLIGVFAGATNTPFASFILGIELFGGADAEFIFLTCVVSYFSSGHTGIYMSQKIKRGKHAFISISDNTTLGSLNIKDSENDKNTTKQK